MRLLILLLILWAGALMAQQGPQQSASLQGTITDSSGAVIPAVAINLTGTNVHTATQSQSDGSYTFPAVAAGDYKISVTYPGFAPYDHTLTIQPGIAAQLAIRLTPASGNQQVTVTEDRGPEVTVDPSQNASAVAFKDNDLDALPDDPDDLSDMLTALAGPSAGNGDAPPMIIDGFSGGELPPKNTIKEIRLNQNPFSAEYGYLGFGRIEIITKPGTDTLHGNFQLTDSDAFFNSRNPYAANKAAYINRAFNETLAGSLKHKLSWSLNANQNTIDNDAIIHAVTLDPSTLISEPVDESIITPRRNLAGTARVDYQISGSQSATARFTYNLNDRQDNGIGQYSLLSRAYNSEGNTQELQLSETAVINPSTASETRFLFSRAFANQFGDTSTPGINVDGAFTAGGNQVGNAYNRNQRYDLQNVSTWIHGTHTVRFGARWIHSAQTDYSPANFGGTFTFLGVGAAPALDANNQPIPNTSIPIDSLEQYRRTLLFEKMGYPMSTVQALGGGASEFSIAGGNPLASAAYNQIEIFAQDDWRVRPNITLSIGLRHEQQTYTPDNPIPIAPRLGFAWSPHSTAAKPGKTVIRLGAGVFFDRFGTSLAIQSNHYNGVNEKQYLITDPGFYQNIPSLSTLAAQQQPPVTWKVSPNMKPDIDTIEAATLERQLPRKSNLTVTFLHITGNHFPMIVNINTPLPGTYNPNDPTSGIRPYGNAAGNIFQYESAGIYRQKLTMVKWETKITKAVSLTANYTLQFSEHDGNWLATPSNPYNFLQDYGRAGYDRRHQVNLVGTIQLPGHLQFSPMIVAASGAPYDLTVGHDLNGDSFGTDRPAFATDLSRPSVVFTKFGAFDTAPMPGQTIVPHNYLQGTGMWNVNARLGRTFNLGHKLATANTPSTGAAATASGSPGESRFKLNFNVDVNNIFNHLNPGGYVGNLSSPLFGQPTSILLFRETSNLRRVQFGTSITF